MKKLKEKDPLHLRQSPGSGKAYLFLFMFLCLLAAATVFFVIYFISPRGKYMREYNSDLYSWTSNNLATKFASMSLAFKILPVFDALRNRDMFILEYHSYPI